MNKLLLLLLIFVFGCEKENTVDPAEGINGIFRSTSFIEAGAHDGGVDIHAAGGYVIIEFENNFHFTAEIYIPDSTEANFAPGKILYEGKYTFKNDSIIFNESEFFIDHLVFTIDDIELKYEQTGRGFMEIVLLRDLR